jgi:hypothetical protein
MQLVIRSSKARIRNMCELVEAEQDDSIIPDKCVYHKDQNLDAVLNHIRVEYDELRREDERESFLL